MFFVKRDIKKKSPRQGSWPQKYELRMHQKPEFQLNPLKKQTHPEINPPSTIQHSPYFSEIGRRGIDFHLFFIFHRFLLKMGVLVHPQSGLLWPASLPGAFLLLLVNVTFAKKHYFC